MKHSKLICRAGANTTGTGGIIDAANEVLQVDVEDLERANLVVRQVTDDGTVTLVVEKSYDGTVWVAFGANYTEASFAAADGAAVERAHETTAGMPLRAKAFRIRATALAGGGVYSIYGTGSQIDGYKS